MMIGLDNGTSIKHCIFLIFSQQLGRSLVSIYIAASQNIGTAGVTLSDPPLN
jgi:hypothetical protein